MKRFKDAYEALKHCEHRDHIQNLSHTTNSRIIIQTG